MFTCGRFNFDAGIEETLVYITIASSFKNQLYSYTSILPICTVIITPQIFSCSIYILSIILFKNHVISGQEAFHSSYK